MKFIILFFISLNLHASLNQAPPNFKHKNNQAVFVDFIKAHYSIQYKVSSEKAIVESTIDFFQTEDGMPLFDSLSSPYSISVDGEEVSSKLIYTPHKVTKVRMVQKKIKRGYHSVTIRTLIEHGTRFNNERRNWGHVSSGFFIRDLKDRQFLEQYLPTNLEYDQYSITMDVKVLETKRHHSLFVNGKLKKIADNHFHVEMPRFYSTSSVYFHLVPINKYVRWYLKYPSISGREISVTIYSQFRFYNKLVKEKAWKVLAELEADYGPYPHESLIIYGTGIRGGMEHAGATETSIVSLGHELQHMYFAKGIHPANGNSGWLDEAIASWRDKGHQTHEKPFYNSVNLGNHNVYTRKTDKRSYEYGRSFMAYLDYTLKDIGKPGLKDFLKIYFEKRKFTTITTQDFMNDLEEYAQMSFIEDFNQYIYGINQLYTQELNIKENPHHPKRTQEEMDSIL